MGGHEGSKESYTSKHKILDFDFEVLISIIYTLSIQPIFCCISITDPSPSVILKVGLAFWMSFTHAAWTTSIGVIGFILIFFNIAKLARIINVTFSRQKVVHNTRVKQRPFLAC